jgi:hypothetical protein
MRRVVLNLSRWNNHRMKRFLTIVLSLSCSLTGLAQNWTGISDCGTYEVKGVTRSTKQGPVIIVNEKTQSEFTITVPIQNEATLAPYVDKAIVAEVTFQSPTRGSVNKIKTRIPNPLSPKDSGVQMVTKSKCK